ncbi:MAG: hypothetical protein LBH44_06720 [Treponema sp.]|nr:hypothetical protein [Treponema sp.]
MKKNATRTIAAGAVLMLFAIQLTVCKEKITSGESEKVYIAAVEAYSEQDYSAAMRYIDTALALDRNFFQAMFLKGRILFFTGRMADAEKLFNGLIKKHPEYTEARIWHIRCLILNEKYGEAEKIIERELSFNTTDWRVYYLYALLGQKTENHVMRISMNRKAETALVDSAKVYLDLALTYQTFGEINTAIGYLDKASIVTEQNIGLSQLEQAFRQAMRE